MVLKRDGLLYNWCVPKVMYKATGKGLCVD